MRGVLVPFAPRGLVLAVALAACGKVAPVERPPVAVTVVTSLRGDAPYVVTANGVVEPMQTVAVQSQVGGVLTSVGFHEGEDVEAGRVLFEIDPRPYTAALQQAEAVLARDQAQADNARREAERFAALVQKDYVTKSQADQAAANADALKAAVDADRAEVATARFNLENATIRAPVSGKTGSLLVRVGNLVRPGADRPLVVINQLRPILVRFAIGERDFPIVQRYAAKGALVARATTARDTVATETGTLSFVDNGVDTTTGTVTLKARFANTDRALWPGQFVSIDLQLYVQRNAVKVPSQAVMPGQDGNFVFVIDDKGIAATRPVVAGRSMGDTVVIDRGLEGGERIVTDGQSRIVPGARVEIKAAGGTAATAAVVPAAARPRAAP